MFKPSGALDSKNFEQKTAEELLDDLCDFLTVLNDESNEMPKRTNEDNNVFYIANEVSIKAKALSEGSSSISAKANNMGDIDIDEEIERGSVEGKSLKTYRAFCLETGNFENIILFIKRLLLKTSACKNRGENYEINLEARKEVNEYIEDAKRIKKGGDVPFWIKMAMDTFISCFSVFDCKDDNEQKGRIAVAMRCVIQTIADKKRENEPDGPELKTHVMNVVESCRANIFALRSTGTPELNRLKRVQ